MIEESLRLLLPANGHEDNNPALAYGVWLAGLLGLEATLLGIVEAPQRGSVVEASLAAVSRQLAAAGVGYETRILEGESEELIPEQTGRGNYLTVLGPLGHQPWKRWLRGRSFRRIMEGVFTPMIYVRAPHHELKKILICMGGLGYAAEAESAGLYLAKKAGAAVTLFHVVEPITFDYPVAREVQENWEAILETDTPQGRNLRESLARAQRHDLAVNFRVAHGNLVYEIVNEIQDQAYDLVAMGSPYSVQSLRHLYRPNVTAEVADAVDRPILTARHLNGHP